MLQFEKNMNLKLAPATEENRGFFIYVHHAAYRPVVEKMFGWDEETQDGHANRAFDGGNMNIVYLEDKKIGVVGLEEHSGFLWLKEVFLLPEYQGKGIGSHIVTAAIDKARKSGKEIRLQTLKANLDAKKLYERHGFNVTEATDIHWKMSLKP